MAGSLNSCAFIGNLGRDAELRYTPGGDAVATLNLACNESWTDKQGQKQERVEWVRVVLWGKTAEALAEYLTKGKQIYVAGRMQTRKWTDKQDIERYTTEIRGDRVVLLGGGERRDGAPPREHAPAPARAAAGRGRAEAEPIADAQYDDDIPF